jgi:hypothetical protein
MKIKICKGPKFKSQPYSFGVTNPNWDINEGRYVVSFNNLNKIMQIIEDGEIFDKEGKPVLALDVATEILKQNRFNDSSIGGEGAIRKDYYGSHFLFDYSPELKEFFQKNRLPIPEDGLGIADRAINAAFTELKVKGIADDLPTAEELSAFLATKRAKQNQNTKIGIGMAEPQEPVASIELQEPVVGKAKK